MESAVSPERDLDGRCLPSTEDPRGIPLESAVSPERDLDLPAPPTGTPTATPVGIGR